MNMQPLTIKLPHDLIARLKVRGHARSLETGERCTPSSIVRELIERALSQEGR